MTFVKVNALLSFLVLFAVKVVDGRSATAVEMRELTEVAGDVRWHSLLHYKANFVGGYESVVDDMQFFFSRDGKNDPFAEFNATYTAFLLGFPKIGAESEHPQCAFPARRKFFTEIGFTFPKVHCEAYEYWQKELNVTGVSLVFATEYEQNPASMFGHLFLRLHMKEARKQTDYGAAFQALPTSNGLFYFIDGLIGNFRGVLQITPFYQLLNEYTLKENRHLIEYPLRVNKKQIDWLHAHLYELHHYGATDYYFLNDNCASFLLETLRVMWPEDEKWAAGNFVISPPEIVQKLAYKGVLKTPQIREPQIEIVKKRFEQLLDGEKRQVRLAMREKRIFPSLSTAGLDTLLDWMQFRKSTWNENQAREWRDFETDLLIARSLDPTPPSELNLSQSPYQTRVDKGHSPQLLLVRAGSDSHSNRSSFQTLIFRSGLHHYLDSHQGYSKNLSIEYLGAQLTNQKESYLLNLNILKITSKAPANPLEFRWAWMGEAGVYAQKRKEKDLYRNGVDASAGIGVASTLNSRIDITFYAITQHDSKHSDSLIDVGGRLLGHWNINYDLNLAVIADVLYDLREWNERLNQFVDIRFHRNGYVYDFFMAKEGLNPFVLGAGFGWNLRQ